MSTLQKLADDVMNRAVKLYNEPLEMTPHTYIVARDGLRELMQAAVTLRNAAATASVPDADRAIEAQRAVSHYVNQMCHDPQDFVKLMAGDHRTLQQGFTRLCIAWLQHCAGLDRNGYDLRNEASVELAKKMLANVEHTHLPFI